ncbi:MAG TPA: SUF system NifU family Fe-S cluster assembly protein [Myxococcota bacterium]|nr:SUF system NifU family Fe-S cluster assembly protein [Myxococcota bacterium]
MSADLRELYQTMILDHYKKPRNYGRPAGADRQAEGVNPLCGDHVHVYAKLEDDRVAEVGFEGSGCAISTAAASLMTQAVKGRTTGEVGDLFARYHELVTGRGDVDPESLGKLAVLAGVREFPARVKCATLSWHALRAALEGAAEPVSTE